jgi:CRISPR/Cas system CSM-associated protein Csm2 small subunit
MATLTKIKKALLQKQSKKLYIEITSLINTAKENVKTSVNKELTMLNWNIGKQLNETLSNTEESYGMEIVATVSPLLMQQFGKGYTTSALHRIHRFYKAFPKIKIVATLSPLLIKVDRRMEFI